LEWRLINVNRTRLTRPLSSSIHVESLERVWHDVESSPGHQSSGFHDPPSLGL